MKLCMMSYTMSRQPEYFDLRAMLELTREIGLEGIDFVSLHGEKPETLKAMADDYEIPIAAYTFFADLNAPDAAGRQPGVDAARQGLEDALVLGVDKVMIPVQGKPDRPREESRRHIIAGLQEIAEDYLQAGVVLTIENFPGANSAFVVSSDVLSAMAEVPGLALTFDNGNVFTGGEDPAESFRKCAEHVVHAHFKDWDVMPAGEGRQGSDGRWYQAALIGEGAVDQKSCLQAMKDAGYDGYINLEYEGNKYRPDEAVRKITAYLRGLMEELS